LPASVTTVWSARAGASIANVSRYCATGIAISTKSALPTSRVQSSPSITARSTTPRASARSRFERERPTPMMSPTAQARRTASAQDAPIRPTPMTISFSMRTSRSGILERLAERGKKALVFRRRADRYAQPRRQVVIDNGTHDDAPPQQRLEDGIRVARLEENEVAARRQKPQAQRAQPVLDLSHSVTVHHAAVLDVLLVAKRRERGRLRERVHVEGLPHAVHQIGDRSVHHAVAHAQCGETVRLGKRVRHDEIRVPLDPGRRIRLLRWFEEFVVGLIEHDDHLARHRRNEAFDNVTREPGSRRIV